MRMRAAWLPILALAFAGHSLAQDQPVSPMDDKLGITQKLGAKIPFDLKFKDETGATVRLGDYFDQGRPILLVPLFYECKSACLLTRDGVLQVLNLQKRMEVGKDFDIVVFSIKPGETPRMAADAKKYWTENYRGKGSQSAWHFLVGEEAPIMSITSTIGFKYTYDKKEDMVIHPTAIVFVTPDGAVSYYLEGANYPALEFQTAIQKAQTYGIGPQSQTVHFPACYAYDPKTGKLRLAVENILLWLGLLTLCILAFSVVHMSFKYRRAPLTSADINKGGDDAAPSAKA